MLAASIVLNIFLAAVIGGHLLRNHFAEVGPRGLLVRALARAEASLSPADAAAFRAVLHRDAPQYEPAAKQLSAARGQLEDTITAEQFDEDAVRQALATWRVASDHFFDAFSEPLVDALAKISPDGRLRLVTERDAERRGIPAH
ncbi:MAG: periplasmic heavy metal sensor [Alphaproteobacteria bacterium]|nr:periplasmic heavy metal sensor [Alphaproteobacteria bacterium]